MFSWSLNYRTDNIKLGKKIGSGAQAEIFKAKSGLDDVVVKRFLDSTDKHTRQEVDIIKHLTHKHIVQFYHVHHDMIVMEYVEGGSLTDAIVGKGLKSWEIKTQIAKEISLGLAYLHSQGIIHCDIKSSNILLTEHKEVRICDFGLALRADETSGGGGTLHWMAPELLQNPPQYTSKSDVYALGMVMWEMASGSTQPYREHTPNGMMYCIMHGILEEYPGNTPVAYAACIEMCWMLDPSKRPAAIDVLPDIVDSSSRGQDAPEQRQKKAVSKYKMDHYLKALTKTFKTKESVGFMEMLKNGGMLRDTKTMDWFDSFAGGSGSAQAMFTMGTMYYTGGGGGVQVDYGEALEWYLAACEAGIAVAMLKVSQMYQYGRGVDQNDNTAALWYCRAEKAVNEQGRLSNRMVHHDAGVSEHHGRIMEWFGNTVDVAVANIIFQIGNMYHNGPHLEKDYNKAMEWYLKANDNGNTDAMRKIGVMYDIGQGVTQDYGKAMEWYLKASDAGDAIAMGNIGFMYDNGQGVEQDYGKAMEWFLKASDAGDADAAFNIGIMYNYGQGVEQDDGKAMEWYLKASDAGNASAMGNIGYMYDNGQGATQDYGKAMEWFLKASDAGDADAAFNIGIMYNYGQGVEQDDGKAMEWYLKASDAGNASAMGNIGFMYENGQGVTQDYGKAKEWYLKASDAGNTKAMRNIGSMYNNGQGVTQDYGKAMEWYLKASDAGDADAAFNIGIMYKHGQGVEQDDGKAMEWFTKARDAGSVESIARLKEMQQGEYE